MATSVIEYEVGKSSRRKVHDLVDRYLDEAERNKATGKFTLEVEVQDGGVTSRWGGTRYKDKQ